MSTKKQTGKRTWLRWTLGIGGGVVILAGGAYLAGYFLAGDNLPANTTIHGVHVGGLGRQEAIDKLTKELAQQTNPEITLTADDVTESHNAEQWGLAPDYEASVDAAKPERSFDPTRIWFSLTGGAALQLQPKVDEAVLAKSVDAFAQKADRDAVNATITYKNAAPVVTDSSNGVSVDTEATQSALRDAYLQSESVTAVAELSEPDITTQEATDYVSSYAKPAVTGDVKVTVNSKTLTVTPAQIAAATTFEAKDSLPSAKVDYSALLKALAPQVNTLGLTKAKDASFTFTNGKPVVVPSQDGVELSADALSKAVEPALTKTGAQRTGTATVSGKKASLTTQDAQKLGVKEVIGEFTTYFPGESYRFTNIGLAAKGINQSLVIPGKSWSLNETLGERTTAKGYVPGSYINGGALQKTVGGGISQSATTTFNAVFFAGLKIDEHHPHTLYYTRYPAGREATVSWPDLDLKFTNDSKYGVVLQAFITRQSDGRGALTVRVWSTKTYDVKSSELRRSNTYYNNNTEYNTSSSCVSQGATPGFDVNYERLFYTNGSLVKTEKFHWRYDAGVRIVCGPKPTPAAANP